ncbi:MAG: LysE family transporter [Gammaproteobacteria bacterium]|jgi:threonine/homoserine/homoserine lactone efflux protein
MLHIILTKILLGISLAAPIGPVNVEMIKRGLASGFWGAFSVRLGGAITNSVCLLVAYLGLAHLMKHPSIILTISGVGEIVLIYMGITTIIKACSKNSIFIIATTSTTNISHLYTLKNGILTGILLASASPIGIMFWLTSFAASIPTDESSVLNFNDLFINFFIIAGVLLWGGFMSGLLHFGNKIIDAKKLRIISGLSGLLLIYFGIKYGLHHLKHV